MAQFGAAADALLNSNDRDHMNGNAFLTGRASDSVPIMIEKNTLTGYGAATMGPSTIKPRSLAQQFDGVFPMVDRRFDIGTRSTRLELLAPYICELLGTFLLVFIAATCNYVDYSKEWSATAIGCAVVALTSAVGFVSGGHLNPAVSLAALITRKISGFKFACYFILQLFGGMLAGLCFEIVFLTHTSSVAPWAPFRFAQAAIVEFIFTAMICFVWLNVVAWPRNNSESDRKQFFSLAIGAAYIASGYACCHISGSFFNPSLAIGLDLAGWWRGGFLYGFLYALVELAGALLAALLYRVCRRENIWCEEAAVCEPTLAVRMFTELVGTFFVVSTFGLNVIMLSTATAWAAASALLCLTYALTDVSGGHFNPAVTMAIVLSRRNKCSVKDGTCLALAQLLAGILAGGLMWYVHVSGPTALQHFGLVGLTSHYSWGASMVLEILLTFFLAYVVLAVSTADKYDVPTARHQRNFYFATAIGFAMCAGSFAAGRVSGGYLNPVVALGFAAENLPSLMPSGGVKHFLSLVASFIAYCVPWAEYFAFELIGGALAALVFRLTHPAEFDPEPLPWTAKADFAAY